MCGSLRVLLVAVLVLSERSSTTTRGPFIRDRVVNRHEQLSILPFGGVAAQATAIAKATGVDLRQQRTTHPSALGAGPGMGFASCQDLPNEYRWLTLQTAIIFPDYSIQAATMPPIQKVSGIRL